MGENKKGLSRRDFLKTTGIATGAVVGGGILGGVLGYNMKDNQKYKTSPPSGGHQSKGSETDVQTAPRGLMFFTNSNEYNVIGQAVERIFPEDDLGPGAIGLGVPFFIDNQLAGNYGNNTKEYMQGPFKEGAPTQGYQSRLTRGEIFRQGIQKLDEEANKRYGEGFTKLEGSQMDEILTDFQKNEIVMKGVESSFFFALLRQATLEGAYADPIYNGNANMEAWRMKGFPGHQMSFINEIEKDEFIIIEPESISSMQG